MSNKDKSKVLTSKQWKALQKKLQNKIDAKKGASSVKLRKDLTPEELARLQTEYPGAQPSTTNGFINSLARQNLSKDSPLPENPLSREQSFAEETPLAEEPIVGETPLPGETIVSKDPFPHKPGNIPAGEQETQYTKAGESNTIPPQQQYPSNNASQSETLTQSNNSTPIPSTSDSSQIQSGSCISESSGSCISESSGSSPNVHTDHALRKLPADEGLYSPSRNSFDLLKLLQSGAMDASELTIDERVIVVRSLKMAGRTQDEIAAMMRISRRMVQRDYERIRELDKHTLMSYELEDLGGEIYTMCTQAAYGALKAGKFSSVSKVLESMTNMLQSMGLVYRAPAKSQVAAMVGVAHTQVGQRAYQSYQDSIEGERDQVLDVLSKILVGVQEKVV